MTLTPTGVWEVNGQRELKQWEREMTVAGWLAGREERRILPAADGQRQRATRGVEIGPRRRSKAKNACPGDLP